MIMNIRMISFLFDSWWSCTWLFGGPTSLCI